VPGRKHSAAVGAFASAHTVWKPASIRDASSSRSAPAGKGPLEPWGQTKILRLRLAGPPGVNHISASCAPEGVFPCSPVLATVAGARRLNPSAQPQDVASFWSVKRFFRVLASIKLADAVFDFLG